MQCRVRHVKMFIGAVLAPYTLLHGPSAVAQDDAVGAELDARVESYVTAYSEWLCAFNRRCNLAVAPVEESCTTYIYQREVERLAAYADARARELFLAHGSGLIEFLGSRDCSHAAEFLRDGPAGMIRAAFGDPETAAFISHVEINVDQDPAIQIYRHCGTTECLLGEEVCIEPNDDDDFPAFCRLFADEGQSCNLDFEVPSLDQWMPCRPGLLCRQGRCVGGVSLGSPCHANSRCDEGLVCVEGDGGAQCREPVIGLQNGASCTADGVVRRCGNGLFCNTLGEDLGVCSPRRDVGEACEGSRECDFGARCVDGACRFVAPGSVP